MSPKVASVATAACLLSLLALGALAEPPTENSADGRRVEAVRVGVSAPLHQLKPTRVIPFLPKPIPNRVDFQPPARGPEGAGPDVVRQSTLAGSVVSMAPTPAPLLSFDGTSDDDNAAVAGGRVVPPDTEGDVGPNHYVQMNNLVYEVFDKSGNSLLGPLPNDSIWSGFGGICEQNNDGDPIVLYDQGADRWVLSQFGVGSDGHQCIAVSQTGDPTGAYYLYDFVISPGCFNDYPKMGVWPDGYYLTANEFCGNFRSAIAVAFEKPAMLTGSSASAVVFDIDTPSGMAFAVQPSHWEGPTAPAAGRPNVFVQAFDTEAWGSSGAPDGYQLWEFSVDWASSNFSFSHLGQANTPEFDANLCNYSACVPQPGAGERLDTLSQFTMYRAHYRKFSDHETIVVNHTVDADGGNTAGIRWAELRNTGSGWSTYQTGTYAPADGEHRWMGSANMDGSGNIAVAYSLSSSSTYPSVMYNSRSASDPLGQLGGGEVACHLGTGVQQSSYNRWGDYSTLSVDPSDDCTFWLTNEYYANSGPFDFKTRICAFKLDDCGTSCEPNETPEATCDDGIDNDCDGFVDCADSDCADDLICSCGNGTCEPSRGETCQNCEIDCPVFPIGGAACGNGVCEAANGEDCQSCAVDCNGLQKGKPSGRFCCGSNNSCAPSTECNSGSYSCTETFIEPPSQTCCGDTTCEGPEDPFNCSFDCGEPPSCGNGLCEFGEDSCSCSIDCGAPPTTEVQCSDGVDNDCDGLVDGADPDCSSCELLPPGALCQSDSECCSGKCRGKPGEMVCKG